MGLTPTNTLLPLRSGLVPSRGCGGGTLSTCSEVYSSATWIAKQNETDDSITATFSNTEQYNFCPSGELNGTYILDREFTFNGLNCYGPSPGPNYLHVFADPIPVCTTESNVALIAEVFCGVTAVVVNFKIYRNGLCQERWQHRLPFPVNEADMFTTGTAIGDVALQTGGIVEFTFT